MRGWRKRAWLPWLAGVAALGLSAVAAFYAATATIARERLQFETTVRHAENEIAQRLAAYVAMLRAGAGLFAAVGDVNRAQFRAYVERLDLPRVYPGIQGIGLTVRVDRSGLAPLQQRMTGEGFGDFRVWPVYERDEYHAIIYLEPLERRNRAAIGYDMFTDPIRRAAMEFARDTGQPAASGRVTLVQEIDERKQAGFLIYVPLYHGGDVPATLEARRAKLVGYVYSPFRAADLLEATVAGASSASVTLAVYDGDGPHGEGLLYQSAARMAGAVTTNRSLVVAGRPWTLQFAAHPVADELSARTLALLILTSGLIFSALLAGALHGELRARQAAEAALTAERRARDQAEQLAAVSRALTSTLDVPKLAEMIVDRVRVLTGASASILYRAEGPSSDLRLLASSGEVGTVLVRGTVIPSGTGTVGRAVSERRTVFTSNFLNDPSITVPPSLRPASAPVPYRSVLAMPLTVHEHVIGALAIGDAEGRSFTVEQVAVAEAFASQAATVLENARLLQEAQAARASAEDANRTKDEFLATVSHELRTPLNAILGWARMLGRGKLGSQSPTRALEIIERNAVTQAQLVDDLLDVSRIISGKIDLVFGQVDVARVIEAAVDAVRPTAEAGGVRLHTVFVEDKIRVPGDADRLQQVVWNLLTNAIKFTPPDGEVEARLDRSEHEALIVVRDTGAGIDPEVLPHVFERFRQADSSSTRAHRGLGIGLALVKHLVELHGGTVTAESAGAGLGSTFVVRLPRSSTEGASALDRFRPERGRGWVDAPVIHGLRVLAVDDDPDSLDVLATMLTGAGADVRTAGSAEGALRLLDEWPAQVLLSDLEMPGTDGFALVQQIRAHGDARIAGLPAIALTAYGRMEDRIRALSSGFNEHVTKPFDPAGLVAAIAAAVGRG